MGKNLWTPHYRHSSLQESDSTLSLVPYYIPYLPKSDNNDGPILFVNIDTWCKLNCSGSFLIAEGLASFENPEDLALFILRWV